MFKYDGAVVLSNINTINIIINYLFVCLFSFGYLFIYTAVIFVYTFRGKVFKDVFIVYYTTFCFKILNCVL